MYLTRGTRGRGGMVTPQQTGCAVVGCRQAATGVYLHAADSGSIEFGICDGHYAQMQDGKRPVVVADRWDAAAADGPPVLILE